MSFSETTAITLTYLFNDGKAVPMGQGTIDARGMIAVTDPAPGQETYIRDAITELNARDNVILKEPPAEDQPETSVNKRKVYRTSREFLSALKDYGLRVYAMRFDFDESQLQPVFVPDAEDVAELEELAEPVIPYSEPPDPDAIQPLTDD